MNTTTLQEDLDDLFNWTTILTERDENDALLSRLTEFDDGTTRAEEFVNGVRSYTLQTDLDPMGGPSSVKSWETFETYYDMNGQREAQFELRDDGTTRLKLYEENQLRQITLTDQGQMGEPSPVKTWETIDIYFDANGDREATFRLDDNGVTTLSLYEAGVLRSIVQEDLGEYGGASDVKTWERIETYYDANGDKEARFKLDDDGVTTLHLYEAGVLRSILQEDLGEYGDPSDARSWESIETFYDENGVREARVQVFDNGVTTTNEYENGVLRVSTQEDFGPMGEASSVKPWESITTFYSPEGQQEARETIYDNEDVTAYFYEDGLRSLRLDYDGDDSNTWLVRETLYDEAGQVAEVNTYDTAADVPPDYGFVVAA